MAEKTSAAQRPARKPSLDDVAERAGVSGQTVSRVANGLPNVGERTRSRVLEAMGELGYRPNNAARALRAGQFRSIGIMLPHLASNGGRRTLEGVALAASRAGYSTTLVPIAQPGQNGTDAAFAQLQRQTVDGIIVVIESRLLDGAEATLPPGLPVVVIDAAPRNDYPVVDTDQGLGARLATQHLLDLGHETVWHIAGVDLSSAARYRERAWRETLEEAERFVPPVLRGDWSAQSGYRTGLEIADHPEITAVFSANDQMALGLMRALHESGRRIPEDISVVGFDDLAESDSFWPPLTTIHVDFDAMGKRGIELLLEQIKTGKVHPGMSIIPPRLIVRQSTAHPRP